MPWWDFLKKKDAAGEPEPAGERPAPQRRELPVVGSPPRMPVTGRRAIDPNDPAVQARRRQRLERRVRDLRYDVSAAESALQEENRWTERIEQVTQAIDQARHDMERVLAAPADRTAIPLPPLPVVIERVHVPQQQKSPVAGVPPEPSEVTFSIGETRFHYSEDIDWAERGHQQTEPQLRRLEGDIAALMPDSVPPERVPVLREHLAHGLGTLAERLRDNVLDAQPQPDLTLADLASPCPECGGWRDLRGRCPACQERRWQADRLRADMDRLLKERNDQLDDLQRMRERLPLLRRQLMDAESELAALGER
jgi:hypothetical protein